MHPNRPDIVVNHYNTTAEHLIRSAEQSLLNLHTDYLDLYLVHRPRYAHAPQRDCRSVLSIAQAVARCVTLG
ncbi:MAG UNVERIFIED_CONTAM: aldo/keto reductase [Anaerolineae bacterium]